MFYCLLNVFIVLILRGIIRKLITQKEYCKELVLESYNKCFSWFVITNEAAVQGLVLV